MDQASQVELHLSNEYVVLKCIHAEGQFEREDDAYNVRLEARYTDLGYCYERFMREHGPLDETYSTTSGAIRTGMTRVASSPRSHTETISAK